MEIQEMLLRKYKLLLNPNAVCLENHGPWSYEVLKAVNGRKRSRCTARRNFHEYQPLTRVFLPR